MLKIFKLSKPSKADGQTQKELFKTYFETLNNFENLTAGDVANLIKTIAPMVETEKAVLSTLTYYYYITTHQTPEEGKVIVAKHRLINKLKQATKRIGIQYIDLMSA